MARTPVKYHEPREIRCQDCGIAVEVRRSDAKYCVHCSFMRVIRWARKQYRRNRRCCGCNVLYRPHRSPDNTGFCGECLVSTLKNPINVDCNICRRTSPGPDRRLRVCFACIRHPDKQMKVMKGLRERQERNRKENPR